MKDNLTLKHAFATEGIKIKILKSPDSDPIYLNNNGDNKSFSSTSVEKITVTVIGKPDICYIKCPSSSDLTFVSKKERTVKLNIIKSHLEIPAPLSEWKFEITIPETSERPDNVTVGDAPPGLGGD